MIALPAYALRVHWRPGRVGEGSSRGDDGGVLRQIVASVAKERETGGETGYSAVTAVDGQ